MDAGQEGLSGRRPAGFAGRPQLDQLAEQAPLAKATPLTVKVHPIEVESYRIMAARVDLSAFGPAAAAVVARVIHASADVDYAQTMVVDEASARAGVAALALGAPVLCDVQMVLHGLAVEMGASCHLARHPDGDDADAAPTRAAAGIRRGAALHPDGAVVVVGCAPTALTEVIRLNREGKLRPALVVGLPVGFVGAAQAKEALRASGIPSITNVGEKGGSAVAAAAVNALFRLAGEEAGRLG